jgi:hypothetical protein
MDDKNQTLYDQLRDVLAAPGRTLRTQDDVLTWVRRLVSIEQGARKCMPLNSSETLSGNFIGCFAEAVRHAAHEAIQRSPLNAEVTALKAELAEAMKTTVKPVKQPTAAAVKERKKKVDSLFRDLLSTAMINEQTVFITPTIKKAVYAQAKQIINFLESQE